MHRYNTHTGTTRIGGSVVIRDKAGKFKCVPDPLFFDGQIVTTSQKHYSQKDVTMLLKPTWNEKRGWIYGEQYCDVENGKIVLRGGTWWWNEEVMFEPIKDSKLKLMSELYYKEKTMNDLSARVSVLKEKIEKINYALSLIN